MSKKQKDGGFFSDFKKFISRGNVVDMAVGVVVGGAFGKIVTGLVNYIINPFVGIFLKDGSLDSVKTVIVHEELAADGSVLTEEVALLWGTWLQTIIDFLIVALCIFTVVRILTKTTEKLRAKEIAEKKAAEDAAKQKAEEEAAAAKALADEKEAENERLRTSVLNNEQLLSEILAELKKRG